MRVIASVSQYYNGSTQVDVVDVSMPGHPREPWLVRPGPGPASWLSTRLEDSRGRLCGWTGETSDLASALDVCLMGRPDEDEEENVS